jgi:hypothetical protein
MEQRSRLLSDGRRLCTRKRVDETFFEGHARKRGNERSLGDHVNWEGLAVIM